MFSVPCWFSAANVREIELAFMLICRTPFNQCFTFQVLAVYVYSYSLPGCSPAAADVNL